MDDNKRSGMLVLGRAFLKEDSGIALSVGSIGICKYR